MLARAEATRKKGEGGSMFHLRPEGSALKEGDDVGHGKSGRGGRRAGVRDVAHGSEDGLDDVGSSGGWVGRGTVSGGWVGEGYR